MSTRHECDITGPFMTKEERAELKAERAALDRLEDALRLGIVQYDRAVHMANKRERRPPEEAERSITISLSDARLILRAAEPRELVTGLPPIKRSGKRPYTAGQNRLINRSIKDARKSWKNSGGDPMPFAEDASEEIRGVAGIGIAAETIVKQMERRKSRYDKSEPIADPEPDDEPIAED